MTDKDNCKLKDFCPYQGFDDEGYIIKCNMGENRKLGHGIPSCSIYYIIEMIYNLKKDMDELNIEIIKRVTMEQFTEAVTWYTKTIDKIYESFNAVNRRLKALEIKVSE